MTGPQPDATERVTTLVKGHISQAFGLLGELGKMGEHGAAVSLYEYAANLRAWLDKVSCLDDSADDRFNWAAAIQSNLAEGLNPWTSKESAAPPSTRSTKNPSATNKRAGRVEPGTAGFTRVGDKYLVRSGFSKKTQSDYHHHAPYDLIVDLARACLACHAAGKPSFTMKDLKNNKDLEKKKHSLGYYYDVLAWLAQIAFVEGAGLRGRYKLGTNFEGVIDPCGMLLTEFERLSEHRN